MTHAPATLTDRLDPHMRAILDAAPPLRSLDIDGMRRHAVDAKARWNDRVTVSVSDTNDALCVSSPGAAGVPIVHLHGGGWSIGSPETHLSLLAGLAHATGRRVIAPRVPQAPEHPYPRPLDATLAALADRGTEPFVLSGDSAGANLALAAMLKAKDLGQSLPVLGLVLSYGCFRRRFDTESHRRFGEGHGLTTGKMQQFWQFYAPEGGAYADLTDADVSGLPPVQLHLAECDPLADDTHWLHDRLSASGVATELLVWPRMAHGFLHYASDLPQARDAFAQTARFIEER